MKRVKTVISKISRWVKNNKAETVILIVILLVSATLRLYKIDQYMTFLGDEGRDMIIVRRLLVDFDLILVGPGTSVGNMYLGPFYYYFIAPALLFSRFSPVGPSVFIALTGIFTVFSVWFIARAWFGKLAGVFASLLYAISPVVIYFSRSSWNPNIMPIFSLLTMYSLWKVWYQKKWSWIMVTGTSLAICLQSHYLAMVLIPIAITFWILSFMSDRKDKFLKGISIKYSLGSLGLFILLTLPLILFDARHGWRNMSAFKIFFTSGGGSLTNDFLNNIVPNTELVLGRLLGGGDSVAGKLLVVLLLFSSLGVIYLRKYISVIQRKAFLFILVWMLLGIIGLSFYGSSVYDHYFGYLFTAPFILFGGFIQVFYERKKFFGVLFVIILLTYLVFVNVKSNAFWHPPNDQIGRSIEVARKMVEESGGKKFNIAVIAERNYEGAYQYFLESWNAPFIIIDPQRYKDTVADQLFVVCEYEDSTKCQPTSNPKTEVANFGWSKIEKVWEIRGIKLYKLVHNYPQ